ncbi:oxidoreductase HTATIP2-like [Amphiura filiformis]|uniref:oxidoreductase HTATIP2-like n=1 Tax=Amphiura filiformis TaxID=82378 RepID=UPI003B211B94
MILNLFFKMSMGEFGEAVSSFVGDTEDPGLMSTLKILMLLLVVSSITRAIFWFAFNRNLSAILTVLGIAVTVFAVFYFLMVELHSPNSSQHVITMADNAPSNLDSYRAQGKTAFVVGYTGETGKELVKELSRTKIFDKVTLIGRRKVEYDSDLLKDFNVEQKIVDFKTLEESADLFQGHDVGYCCLGSYAEGDEGYERVDRDYILTTANLAKQGGTTHFHLVSVRGASPERTPLYYRIKGEVEEKMKSMGFDRLSIYKPGLLMCDREEIRPVQWILQKLFTPVVFFAPYVAPCVGPVPTTTLATALVHVTAAPKQESLEILEGRDIHRLGNSS